MSKMMPPTAATFVCWCDHPAQFHIGGGHGGEKGFCLGNWLGLPGLGSAKCDCMLFLASPPTEENQVKRAQRLKKLNSESAVKASQIAFPFSKGRRRATSHK